MTQVRSSELITIVKIVLASARSLSDGKSRAIKDCISREVIHGKLTGVRMTDNSTGYIHPMCF
jgi:hypothetical protein